MRPATDSVLNAREDGDEVVEIGRRNGRCGLARWVPIAALHRLQAAHCAAHTQQGSRMSTLPFWGSGPLDSRV